jgi:hypothetical protein
VALTDTFFRSDILAEAARAKPQIQQWLVKTFPPNQCCAASLALLQVAIETQLTLLNQDEDHALRIIHRIFDDVTHKRQGTT